MFPFNYIPDSIDPFMRKIIISLICIQFFSFLTLVFYLSYLHFTGKDKIEYEEIKKEEEKKKKLNENNKENVKKEKKNNEEKRKKKD
jgi:hypothetical protein